MKKLKLRPLGELVKVNQEVVDIGLEPTFLTHILFFTLLSLSLCQCYYFSI